MWEVKRTLQRHLIGVITSIQRKPLQFSNTEAGLINFKSMDGGVLCRKINEKRL